MNTDIMSALYYISGFVPRIYKLRIRMGSERAKHSLKTGPTKKKQCIKIFLQLPNFSLIFLRMFILCITRCEPK